MVVWTLLTKSSRCLSISSFNRSKNNQRQKKRRRSTAEDLDEHAAELGHHGVDQPNGLRRRSSAVNTEVIAEDYF